VRTEICQVDTAAQTTRILTDDGGNKPDVWGFYAPEYGGELLYLANVDYRALAIYRDLGGPFLTGIATLTLPTNSPHQYVFSPEPVAGLRGFEGVSYFSLIATPNSRPPLESSDSSIWILGLGTNAAQHIARRVDEGAGSGLAAQRIEPETLVGAREVFLYYNRQIGPNPAEWRWARTGLAR
jgi:hypothetical protein